MDTYFKLPALPADKPVLPVGKPEFSENKKNSALFSNKKKYWTKVFFFFFIISGFLFAEISFLFSSALKDEENELIFKENILFQEEPVVLNENTLLPISNLSNPESKIVKKIPVIVTAYSSTPWETWGDPYLTAAETWVRDGIIANNYLSFGTKVRIPEIYGDKIFVVEDRMNSRKGNYHFDIWFPSYWEAKEFGVKKTYIEVLEG